MWNKVLKSTICVLAVVLIVLCAAVFWMISRQEVDNPPTTQGTSAPTEQTQTREPTETVEETETAPTEETLPPELTLQWEALGDNRFTLNWNEIDCAGYIVELSQDGGENWHFLAQTAAQCREYRTDVLPAFGSFQLRVSTDDGLISDVVAFETEEKLLYSTVWPVQDLMIYKESDGTQSLGMVTAGEMFCVLGEENGAFLVRAGEELGYIDSNYCMINVAEFLGPLCSYDIPNSYSSLYRVHGVDIPDVTDTVITGYENVRLVDGSYLVPLLYPTVEKLLEAAKSARELGYRFKIYDSFRPYKATKDIYAKTEKILDDIVPDQNVTVQAFMTDNGRYRLGNFLAPVTSRHNYGVALDLTLETLEGECLSMQTVMHDLSWYSALENNEENADLLQSIMVQVGFYTLQSEWWHFQDGAVFETLKPAYLTEGVSAEGWVKDDTGWRYRLADGTFLTDSVETIAGIAYEFDAKGYVA